MGEPTGQQDAAAAISEAFAAESVKLAEIGGGVAIYYLLGALFAAAPDPFESLQRVSSRLLLDLEADPRAADLVPAALATVAVVAGKARLFGP